MWQPTPVFLLEKSHEQRSLMGYSPWGCKESDTTEKTHSFFFLNADYFEEYCFFESVQEFHPKLVLSSSSLTP